MQKVLTAEEMREVDRLTTERYGIPSLLLMENAAHAAARVIFEKLAGSVKGKSVLVLCGKGNNGGDGAALARILWTFGMRVRTEFVDDIGNSKNDAQENFWIIEKLSQRGPEHADGTISCLQLNEDQVENWADTTGLSLCQFDVLVDAVFGTGVSRPLGEKFRFLGDVGKIRDSCGQKRPLLISLDLPSGLNSDLNEPIGYHFEADLTVTFTSPKLANVLPSASNFNGELIVRDIGSPKELVDNMSSQLFVADQDDAADWLNSTRLRSDSYKKTRGRALIVAGSEDYSGAAVLAANACFSAGTGMVTVAVPGKIHQIVASKTAAEVIVKPLENINFSGESSNIIALGCGLANDESTRKLIRKSVINRETAMVLDAEALNALAPYDIPVSNDLPLIMTPHIGEFNKLLGREVAADRISEAREFSQNNRVILVLKGERSLIACPDGTVVINPTGNAGVSRAGAGDTLTGIITGFLAQTFAVQDTTIENAFRSVVAAVYLAGSAGDIASEKFGTRLLTATDVRNCLQEAIDKIVK